MLQRMLKDFGHSILTVTDSGEEAIVKSGKLKPDMVLMDIGLSGRVDGVSAAEDIYRRYQNPVIYITAGVDQEPFQRAKKSMPFGYILKPFNQLILMTTIEMGWYRFQAEMDLRESEKRNEDILATIPDIMFTLKRDGSFLSESEADLAARIWPSGEMRQEAMESIERAIVNNQPETFEYTLQRNPENVHCEARIIRSGSETALVIIRDVTERKKVELELEEYRTNLEKKVADRTRELQKINEQLLREIELRKLSEDKIRIFSQAVNQSPISILICDRAGSIEYANKTALELSGYSEEEVMGQGLMNFAGPQPSSGMSMEQAVGPGPWIGEIVGRKKNGEIFYGLSTVSPILDDEEKITHFVVRVDDITRKKMEQMEIDHSWKCFPSGWRKRETAFPSTGEFSILSKAISRRRRQLSRPSQTSTG
jgi:PAS domain S-box-containing protein